MPHRKRPLVPFISITALTCLLSWSDSGLLAATPAGPAGRPAAPSSPAAPGGWLAHVQKDLAEREYRVTWQDRTVLPDLDAAWHAPNRAQGFRTYFVEQGIRVVPRTAGAPGWKWSLALTGYGRGGAVWPVPDAVPSPSENRVEYARGSLTEWYVNDARGLEQGFTLAAPPQEAATWFGDAPQHRETAVPGRGRDVPGQDLIHLDLALGGSLSAKVVAGEEAIDFVTPQGVRAVRYAELIVTDASGRRLPAWMEALSTGGMRGVRLVIDARGAAWPVTVDPLATSPDWSAESDQASAYFGHSVSTAGDVNGDGFADVIVGAFYYDNGQTNEGAAFVYHGSIIGLALSPDWSAESDQAGAYFGNSVSTAGDVDGDGYAEVVVGTPYYDSGETDEGRAFVYLGSATGLSGGPNAGPLDADWSAESGQAGAYFGWSVSAAGDVNGDGYADVIVGASGYDNGEEDEGSAFFFYGNGGGGLSLRPQQRRADDAAPVAHLGMSENPDAFRLALLGRTPFGRSRVKLEWEVKPLGTLFDGTGTQVSAAWADTGAAGATPNEIVSGLSASTVYHWRVRLLYHPAATPLQQASRWLTVPWNGWQEADLRTLTSLAAGRIPDGDSVAGTPLGIALEPGGDVTLSWGASCLPTGTDYEIYEGTLGSYTSHTAIFCTTGGATTKTFTPAGGSAYYLVVPANTIREGSYGTDRLGVERPQGVVACLPQEIGTCP